MGQRTNRLSVAVAVATVVAWSQVVAQEGFSFLNYAPPALDAPVFDEFGNRLAGTNFVAMLYGGPSLDTLQPALAGGAGVMRPVPFTYMPGGQAGYFSLGGYVTIENACTQPAWLQVRAWDARLGSSYDQVVSLDVGGYGQSLPFQLQGAALCEPDPVPPPPLFGMQSFSLVPEPSTWLLLLLGIPTLAIFCRRRPSGVFLNTPPPQTRLGRTNGSNGR